MIPERKKEIDELFRRYLNDLCSPEEVKLLMYYFSIDENEKALKKIITTELDSPPDHRSETSEEIKTTTESIFREIKKKISKKK